MASVSTSAGGAGAQATRFRLQPGQSQFSTPVAEGNYRVTPTFAEDKSSRATVKAEARRLMIEDMPIRPGRRVTRSFIVNVRTPALPPPPPTAPGGMAVRLSANDLASLNWDNQLSLEFLGAAPRAIEIAPVDVPTIYLVGDSTVTDQEKEPAASWGQMLPRFFKPEIAVANHAKSGATLKSFLADLRLDKALSRMKTGDWLLIQFGHNDQKTQWPQSYADAATTFRAYLRAYVAEARTRGATPILLTSPERRNFDAAGRIRPSHGAYPDAVRDVAREEGVALIDLHSATIAFYETLGPQRSPLAFNDDGKDKTHHNNYGAYEIARMVAAGMAAADPRLSEHLLPEAQRYDPSSPSPPERFALPASRARSAVRPEGN